MTSRHLALARLGFCILGSYITGGAALAAPPASPPTPEVLRTTGAAIVAGHPEASRLGMQVLNAGGNAADALVTVSMALGVVEPGNSGIGGKLVLQYYDAKTKTVTCIVALGESPAKVDAEQLPAGTTRGAKYPCTPGLIAGLGEAHKRFGTKPWKELVTPVARLAGDGFELSPLAAEMLSEFPLKADPDAAAIYAPGGQHPVAGARLENDDLANTLNAIAEGGPQAFYTGPIAQKIAASVQAKGGWISEDDLAQYKPRVVEPVQVTLAGHTYYSSPPPLTGGAIMLGALSIMQTFDLTNVAPRDATYMDIEGRALQQVFNVTTRRAADVPDAAEAVKKALSPQSLAELAAIAKAADVRRPFKNDPATTSTSSIGSWRPLEVEPLVLDDSPTASTTHLVIADAAGNIACATQSLGNHFGCGVVPAGTGILLNNDINNFALASKTSVNALKPRKLPRSTMAPTIVLESSTSKPVLAIGTPAAARIPVVLAQVIFDVQFMNRDLGGAVAAPRFHVFSGGAEGSDTSHTIALEPGSDPKLVDRLKAMGWSAKIEDKALFYFGSVNAIKFNADGSRTVVADTRRTGDAEVK